MKLVNTLSALAIASALALPLSSGIAQTAEPSAGGELTVAIDLQPKSLDPGFGDADTIDRYLFNQMYEPLIRLDAEGDIVPVLATDYAFSDENDAIRFTLREGVTFHDGTPFDAAAVKFNIERILDESSGSTRRQDVADVASVEVVSDSEVLVTLNGPSGAALSGFAAEGTLMVSPTAVEEHGEDYGRNPVGTGPFRFVAWPGGERVELEKYADYWQDDEAGNDLPYLDKLTVRTIKNYATALLELESGNVDALDVVNTQDFERLEGNESVALVPTPQVTNLMIALNVSKPPFDDKRVRQALAQSVDREILAKAVAGESGTVTPTFLPPSDWAYDESLKGWGHDPEGAKALLEEASAADLAFQLLIIQREPDATVGQFVQQMMKSSGISVDLQILERQSWIDRVLVNKDFEAAMLRGNFPRIDPHASYGRFFWNQGSSNNWVLHENQAVFDLIDEARATTDLDERKTLYSELGASLLDESYMVWLFNRPAMQAARANVKDIGQDVGGAWVFTRTWLER